MPPAEQHQLQELSDRFRRHVHDGIETERLFPLGAFNSPGGSDTDVQFNDGGILAGDSNFQWDRNAETLFLGSANDAVTVQGRDGGTTNDGTQLLIFSGHGGTASGIPGDITIRGGRAYEDGSDGATVAVASGQANGNGNAGLLSLTAGASLGGGNGGDAELVAGSAISGKGGDVSVIAGQGGDSFKGGLVDIQAGAGGDTGDGEGIYLTSGDGGATSGDAGIITLQGGSAVTEGDGASIRLQPGDGAGSGLRGSVIINNSRVPSAANASGSTGAIAFDTNFIYVCVSGSTWKRVAISTW